MKNRVLILSVGRKVALVKAFKEAGWYVVGQDINPGAVGLRFCDEVASATEGTSVDMILPTRDAELKLGTHRCSDETIDICVDKFRFYEWCKTNGFGTPEVYFIKPRISKSGKETEVLWQELVGGEEYSVDLFADFGGQVISAVPRRRSIVINGESAVTTTVRNEKLLSSSVSLARQLGLIGHNVLQCFMKESGEILWTDVNCRFGGASDVGIRAGCWSPLWLLRLINGEGVRPRLGEYMVGMTGYSFTEWTFGGLQEP